MDWKYLQKDENLFMSIHSFQLYDYPMILSSSSSKEQCVRICLFLIFVSREGNLLGRFCGFHYMVWCFGFHLVGFFETHVIVLILGCLAAVVMGSEEYPSCGK